MRIAHLLRSIGNKEKGTRHQSDAPFLAVDGLAVSYQGVSALRDVNFELHGGEQIAVVGPNGAGKSTLFKAISGVLQTTKGQITMHGSKPSGHICIAYVPQRSEVDRQFPVTVQDVVMMGRVGQLGLFRNPSEQDWNLVRECMTLVQLDDFAQRQIEELSGGQLQRVFIAQALAQEAELLMMDEPLNGLDLPSQEEFFNILELLKQRGVTVMVAMHDLSKARDQFEKIMLLNKKLIGYGTSAEVFTEDQLKRAYGDHLQMVEIDDGILVLNDTCCDD